MRTHTLLLMTNTSRESAKPRERMCLYVDGFNLYNGIHKAYGRKYLWLDLVRLGEKLRPQNEIAAVKYFTADVIGERSAARRQAAYINALTARHGSKIQVIKGRYQSSLVECRSCSSQWRKREEKETDVNIALHILKDTLEKKFDSAILVSGDSDMTPAIRMVQDARPEFFITAAFPPRRKSYELEKLMPLSFEIQETKLRQSQLPALFEDSAAPGKAHTRPSKWR